MCPECGESRYWSKDRGCLTCHNIKRQEALKGLEADLEATKEENRRLREAKSVVLCECGNDGFSDLGDHLRCQECGRKTTKDWYRRRELAREGMVTKRGLTLPVLEQKDLDQDMLDLLWSLASMTGDNGFSFVVRTGYLQGWLDDVATDKEKDPSYAPPCEAMVAELMKELDAMGAPAVFVCNDKVFEEKR